MGTQHHPSIWTILGGRLYNLAVRILIFLVTSMERLHYMETQVGLKTTAMTLFLNLFFHFLPVAALCDDFSLVDSVQT